ncbi:MAG: class I SAM-dependent methyltransferase [Rhodothermales bacterium]
MLPDHENSPPPEPFIRPARLSKTAVSQTYTWIAPLHDTLALMVEGKARRLGLAWAAVQNGENVLEVAVGTGLSFKHLLNRNPNGWTEGIDLTPAMLKRATRRAARCTTENYRLSLGDAFALDFPDATFDLVLNSYMFDLLPVNDFITILQEFYRVLKPGGRLVMMNMTRGTRWYNQVWEGIYRIHAPLLGGCRGVIVEPFMRKAGFENTRRDYVSQWTFPSEVVFGERALDR